MSVGSVFVGTHTETRIYPVLYNCSQVQNMLKKSVSGMTLLMDAVHTGTATVFNTVLKTLYDYFSTEEVTEMYIQDVYSHGGHFCAQTPPHQLQLSANLACSVSFIQLTTTCITSPPAILVSQALL